MRRYLKPALVIIIITAYFYLTNRMFGYICPSKFLIGLPCPGCGLTRAALLLLNRDIAGSLRMNPMLPFIPVYFLLVICKKKNAAMNYLIVIIPLSIIVFGWRVTHSFGAEPLTFNRDNAVCLIIRAFRHFYYKRGIL